MRSFCFVPCAIVLVRHRGIFRKAPQVQVTANEVSLAFRLLHVIGEDEGGSEVDVVGRAGCPTIVPTGNRDSRGERLYRYDFALSRCEFEESEPGILLASESAFGANAPELLRLEQDREAFAQSLADAGRVDRAELLRSVRTIALKYPEGKLERKPLGGESAAKILAELSARVPVGYVSMAHSQQGWEFSWRWKCPISKRYFEISRSIREIELYDQHIPDELTIEDMLAQIRKALQGKG